MPICYFEICDRDHLYKDGTGRECNSVDHMLREAAETAASIARDNARQGEWGSVCVEVVDETGRKIGIATVSLEALEIIEHRS